MKSSLLNFLKAYHYQKAVISDKISKSFGLEGRERTKLLTTDKVILLKFQKNAYQL